MNEDEHKRIEERERAHLARQIMDNPLYAELRETLLGGLMRSIVDTRPEQKEARESRYLQYNASVAIFNFIEQIALDGKLAEMQLQERSNGRGGPKH